MKKWLHASEELEAIKFYLLFLKYMKTNIVDEKSKRILKNSNFKIHIIAVNS